MRLGHVFASCSVALAACGGDSGSKVFGAEPSVCPPTVLRNELDDPERMAEGTSCFLTEFEAGREIVWDVLLPTVEGDPLLWRYDFDGTAVTITADHTRDEFGNAGVIVRRCEGVRNAAGTLPQGVDCRSSSGDGFASDSLPAG